MSYKTILVSLNEVAQIRCILKAAASIARTQEAYVIGLYVIPATEIRLSSELDMLPVEDDAFQKYFKQQEHAVKSAFESAILEGGIHGEFCLVEATEPRITPTVIEYSREADLVIVGYSNSGSSHAMGTDFSERVFFSSGRPTLVMPPNSRCSFPVERVLVGWNGTRESARAVFDSIPLLKNAEVLVASAVKTSEPPRHEGTQRESLVRSLLRHGIDARAIDLDSSHEAGQALLERAASREVGLLVMGAYGHARLREFLLGGATRSVLNGMKCPVLFSH